MSYHEEMDGIAKQMRGAVSDLRDLEKARDNWVVPEKQGFWIGYNATVTRKDGTTNPALVGVKREAIKALDDLIFKKKSEIEGLRFKLIQLGKGAA